MPLRRSIVQTLRAGAAASALLACGAHVPTDGVDLRFDGKIPNADDLSAVERVGRYLVVASDEGDRLAVLEPADDTGSRWTVLPGTIRLLSTEREVDVEALARGGDSLYVLGSHSIKRKLLDPGRTWAENRTRLGTVLIESERHRLFRLRIDPETGRPAGPPTSITLDAILDADPILGPFTRIPGKENGIDAEGLAVDGSLLVVGFRSPVLREGFVPVLRVSFDDPSRHELVWARFGGNGIRSLARVRDGFLVIAAGPGDGGDAELWLWDGRDRVPGRGSPGGRAVRLGPLPARGGTPEGLAVMEETDVAWDVVLVHDGVEGGHPVRLLVAKPKPGGHPARSAAPLPGRTAPAATAAPTPTR